MSLAKGYVLTTGTASDPLLPKLVHAINHATAIDICVSFAQPSGVSLLLEPLLDACKSGATVRIMTSDYLCITHPRALRLLALLQQRGAQVKLYHCNEHSAFHLKSYIFVRERPQPKLATTASEPDYQAKPISFDGTAFVGSSNLSESALTSGHEWNLRFDVLPESEQSLREFAHIRRSFENIFTCSQAHELTQTVIDTYAGRYAAIVRENAPVIAALGVEDESEAECHTPNSVQTEALLALRDSRAAGYQRGLVVLATGMGKTWLSAFDAQQCDAQRVLFVAHREEILLQAQQTYSALFPHKSVGFYNGHEKEAAADLVFASVQSLGKHHHLSKFGPRHFDYIVVDEFHHATARSYQALLSYFQPQFMLGLTATPERTDQSDILSLCDHNLVYERNLIDGIEAQILVPFHYYGIHDSVVDYQEIPWRSGQFDPAALETAFATTKRARHIFNHWQQHKQTRTLGFCISKRHADYMAAYFTKQGVRAVAVYADSKIRRNEALKGLEKGQIEVVFSVDLFNEGTDIPAVDTVLMTRPTESKILFLQQLGRGVRKSPETGKSHVVVLDFIGNHQSFMLKPATILGLENARQTVRRIVNEGQKNLRLPEGCHLNLDVAVIDFWQTLMRTMGTTLADDYRSLTHELNHRPTAAEFYRAGHYHKAKLRTGYGGWLGFVANMVAKTDAHDGAQLETQFEAQFKTQFGAQFEANTMGTVTRTDSVNPLTQLHERHGLFFQQAIESTAMTKCFKIILMQAFVELKGFRHKQGVTLGSLALRSWQTLHHFPLALARDLDAKERALNPTQNEADHLAWLRYWHKNPVAAYTRANTRQQAPWFEVVDDRLQTSFVVATEECELFEAMVLELCELRMAEYVERSVVR